MSARAALALAGAGAAGGAIPALAATAPPWTSSFGRLVEPAPASTVGTPLSTTNPTDSGALDCLAEAIAYEAGNEPASGQAAVAEVVLNRVAHRAFPKTVCGVVFQGSHRRTGCQFTFTCDGSRQRPRSVRNREAARRIAATALAGPRLPGLAGATHYHANYVNPYWAPSLVRIAAIGAHIFYRFPGSIRAPQSPAAAPRPASPPPPPPQFAPWGLQTIIDPPAL